MALPILLTSCGSGVSEEEFEAEQTRAQQLQAEVQALQQRLDRGAAIIGVLDTLTSSFEKGPSTQAILEMTALILASGSPEMQAKWVEISESVQASSDPPPQEAFNVMGAAVVGSGNPEVAQKWPDVVAAVQGDGGGELFLEFATLVQASGDLALQGALAEFFEAVPEQGQLPWQLIEEFEALAEASGNEQIEEAFRRLGEPSPEVINEARVKLSAIGDPSLEALFEAAYESAGEEFDAFYQGMLAALRETLQ